MRRRTPNARRDTLTCPPSGRAWGVVRAGSGRIKTATDRAPSQGTPKTVRILDYYYIYINIIICITIFMYYNFFRVKVSWYELDNKWIVSIQLVGYRWCGTRGRGTSTGTGLTGCLTSSCVILHEYWSISWLPWGVWSPEVKATVSYFYDSSLGSKRNV